MMYNRTVTAVISVIMIFSAGGCRKSYTDINCPFTDLKWESAVEDMVALEGEVFETYDSIYKGTTYTYPKEYLGMSGTIKYMYDDKGRLCNVSWSYSSDDENDIMEVYRKVCDDTSGALGKSTTDDGVGNFCEVWSGAGTVMANAVITNDAKVMQIAYMSPEVSKRTNDN